MLFRSFVLCFPGVDSSAVGQLNAPPDPFALSGLPRYPPGGRTSQTNSRDHRRRPFDGGGDVPDVLELGVVDVAVGAEVCRAGVQSAVAELIGGLLHGLAQQFRIFDPATVHRGVDTRDLFEDVVGKLMAQTMKGDAQTVLSDAEIGRASCWVTV